MKKQYARPEAHEESFRANKFVATCEPGYVKWLIKCDVNSGFGYIDGNKNGQYDPGLLGLFSPDTYIVSGNGCGTPHETILPVGETPQMENARWHENGGADYPVFYFVATNTSESGGSNHHFSKSALEGEATNLGQPS